MIFVHVKKKKKKKGKKKKKLKVACVARNKKKYKVYTSRDSNTGPLACEASVMTI